MTTKEAIANKMQFIFSDINTIANNAKIKSSLKIPLIWYMYLEI